jgi:hypothetical protein
LLYKVSTRNGPSYTVTIASDGKPLSSDFRLRGYSGRVGHARLSLMNRGVRGFGGGIGKHVFATGLPKKAEGSNSPENPR